MKKCPECGSVMFRQGNVILTGSSLPIESLRPGPGTVPLEGSVENPPNSPRILRWKCPDCGYYETEVSDPTDFLKTSDTEVI